jgi:hypothetical protein
MDVGHPTRNVGYVWLWSFGKRLQFLISHNNQRGKHGQCYTLQLQPNFTHGITQEEIHKLISSFSYSISYSYSYSDVIVIVIEHRKSWLVTLWLKQATRSLYWDMFTKSCGFQANSRDVLLSAQKVGHLEMSWCNWLCKTELPGVTQLAPSYCLSPLNVATISQAYLQTASMISMNISSCQSWRALY